MFYGKVVVYVFPTPSEQFLRRQVDLCGVKLPSTYVEYDFGRLPCTNKPQPYTKTRPTLYIFAVDFTA